jgi:hypothetical protein
MGTVFLGMKFISSSFAKVDGYAAHLWEDRPAKEPRISRIQQFSFERRGFPLTELVGK